MHTDGKPWGRWGNEGAPRGSLEAAGGPSCGEAGGAARRRGRGGRACAACPALLPAKGVSAHCRIAEAASTTLSACAKQVTWLCIAGNVMSRRPVMANPLWTAGMHLSSCEA